MLFFILESMQVNSSIYTSDFYSSVVLFTKFYIVWTTASKQMLSAYIDKLLNSYFMKCSYVR